MRSQSSEPRLDPAVLISFLGRQKRAEGGYRQAAYRFADGEVIKTRYFAKALRQKLLPERVVLLGTSGSMWDVLIEDCRADLLDEDTRLALIDAVDRYAVGQPMLDTVARAVAAAWGCEVRLQLIPRGLDESEQVAVLRAMAAGAEGASAVHLDITHGFRSLPMLAIMAAFYLQVARGLHIAGVHYGMFEAPDAAGHVPVVALDGMLRFGRWIGALRQYEKDGDYGVFAPLLEEAGVAHARQLAEAAFYERIADVRRAVQRISTAHRDLESIDEARFPAAAMFAPVLIERLDWFRKPTLAEREWALAEEYLERGDYLRAALLGLEAAVSAEVERTNGDVADFATRKEARRRLGERSGHFNRLNSVRNEIAHGSRKSSKDTKRTLRNEQTLRDTLKGIFHELKRQGGLG